MASRRTQLEEPEEPPREAVRLTPQVAQEVTVALEPRAPGVAGPVKLQAPLASRGVAEATAETKAPPASPASSHRVHLRMSS